jgi:GNAT superfamily N-acetyltransferase
MRSSDVRVPARGLPLPSRQEAKMIADERPNRAPAGVVRLRDGTLCRIRVSGPADRERLAACFETLSPESRRLRFFGVKQALSPSELDIYAQADGLDHIAFAAVRLDPRGRELEALGFARCIRLAGAPESAELSMTVVDAAQGQGIGAALLTRLIGAARTQGIRRFRCEVLAENAGMRRLAKRLEGDAQWLGEGTLEYDCPLPAETESEPGSGLPWFADPNAWMSDCRDTWLTSLEDTLARLQAANDDWDQWLKVACPLTRGPSETEHCAA